MPTREGGLRRRSTISQRGALKREYNQQERISGRAGSNLDTGFDTGVRTAGEERQSLPWQFWVTHRTWPDQLNLAIVLKVGGGRASAAAGKPG